jgi:hypothetical protein
VRVGAVSAIAAASGLLLFGCGGTDKSGNRVATAAPVAAKRPTLRIALPHPGSRTTRSVVHVSGTALDAVQVVVNGKPATLRPSPNGRRLFSVRVRLRLGKNRIVVVARNGSTIATKTITVVRQRPPRPKSPPPTPASPRPPAPPVPTPPSGSGNSQGGPSAPAPSQGGPPAQSQAPPQGGPPAPAPPGGPPPSPNNGNGQGGPSSPGGG